MDNDDALAAQAMMMRLGDTPLHDDGLSAFRRLLTAQADALSGRDDDVYCTEFRPF